MKSIKQKCRHFKSDFLQKYDKFWPHGKTRNKAKRRFRSIFKPHTQMPHRKRISKTRI